MLSTIVICIILFILVDLVILYWINTTLTKINKFQSHESSICPIYYCDQYANPSTGNLEPGSLCYSDTSSSNNIMTAYRYTNGNNYECQKYLVSDNVVIPSENYTVV